MTKEAKILLGNLIQYATFQPVYTQEYRNFEMQRQAFLEISECPQSAFTELEALAEQKESVQTYEEFASYEESINEQNRQELR